MIRQTKQEDISFNIKSLSIEYLIFGGLLFLIYLTSLYNYLLFHTIAELSAITISVGIFIVGWNSKEYLKTSFFLIIGVSFLFIGIIDLIHTLAYAGMNIFIGYGSNLPTSLWIVARYWQAISFLVALFLFKKKVNLNYLILINIVSLIILFWLIFQGLFPVCYIEGIGLTPFKIVNEYIIDIIFVLSLIGVYILRKEFDRRVLAYMIISIVFMILSELAFTFYIGVYDLSNLIGHLFKIIAFYHMYKALIKIGIKEPYNLLFRRFKLNEKELKRKAEQLENVNIDLIQIFEASLPLRIINKECNIIRVNETYLNLFETKKDDVIGKKCYDFYPGDYCFSEGCSIQKILSGNKEYEYTMEYIISENTKKIVMVHSAPYVNIKGKFLGIIQNFTDITEQTRAEERIEEMARLALENPNPVLRTNKHLIMSANKASQEIFNIEEGNPIPKALQLFVDQCFSDIKNIDTELKIGDDIYTFFFIINEEKGYINIYGLNITERIKAKERLERFVSTVSHELRNPISVLVTSTDFLDNHSKDLTPDIIEKLKNGMTKNIYLLKDLVNDLLMLSRIDDRKITLEWEDIKPIEIIQEILTLMEPIGNLKNISFIVNIDPSLHLRADPKRLDQIFRIFIDNAIKYSENNSIVIISATNLDRENLNKEPVEGILFAIEDSGIGISEEDLPHLFERFYRSNKVSDIPGTGLGLSIAKELVELHGGYIEVQSQPMKGTKVSIFIPKIKRL